MRPFADHLALYASGHRDPRNRLTHYVGVPAIVFAAMVALSLVPLPGPDAGAWGAGGGRATAAQALTVAALVYYLAQDLAIGLALTVAFGLLLLAAAEAAAAGPGTALAAFLVAFVGGWAFQLLGHRFEGNRPALLTGLFQVVVSPFYLMAEIFFALGLKRGLASEIDARARPRRD